MNKIYSVLILIFFTFLESLSFGQPRNSCVTATVINMPDTVLPYGSKAMDSMRFIASAPGSWYKMTVPPGKGAKALLLYLPTSLARPCSTGTVAISVTVLKGTSCASATQVLNKVDFFYCYYSGTEWKPSWNTLAFVDSLSDGDTYFLQFGGTNWGGNVGLKYLPYLINSPTCTGSDTISKLPFLGSTINKLAVDTPFNPNLPSNAFVNPTYYTIIPLSTSISLSATLTGSLTVTNDFSMSVFKDCAHVGDYSTTGTGQYKYFYGTTSGYGSTPLTINITNATPGDPLTLVFDAKAYCGVDLFIPCRGVVTFSLVGNGVLLPLSLTNFSATYNKLQNKVSLLWIAETSSKNSRFIVERAGDGKTFYQIGEATANDQYKTYTFFDDKSLTGKIYYRLKLIEADGKFSYSKVVTVNVTKTAFTSIYPNPVHNFLNVAIDVTSSDNADIILMNTEGRIVLSKHYQLSNGRNDVKINTTSLGKGSYFIKVKLGKSGDDLVDKVLVY
jgi:hypothetical protein